MAAVILAAAVPAVSLTYDDLDVDSADAGASKALFSYLNGEAEGADKIMAFLQPLMNQPEVEPEPTAPVADTSAEEFHYAKPLEGKVCVPSALNIRESTTVLSDVVAQVYRGYDILVTGEVKINGRLWYSVGVYEDSTLKNGYVYADYVKIGEAADAYFEELHEKEKQEASMPSEFDISPYDEPSDEALAAMDDSIRTINYSLKNDYNPDPDASSYMTRYAVLSYIAELYQQAQSVAEEYELTETLARINNDLYNIVLTRENLVDESGVDEDLLKQQIFDAREERKAQQALTLGDSIAEYAATYVGILPYVWGGASLRTGADCSGFCAQIYAHFGLLDQASANVHAYDSYALRFVGYPVELSQILPGDLVCYNGHVAIYYGNGLCVNEPAPGRYCSFDSLYMLPIIAVRRLH